MTRHCCLKVQITEGVRGPIRIQVAQLSTHRPGAGYGGYRWKQVVYLKEGIQKNLAAKQRGTEMGKAVRRLIPTSLPRSSDPGDLGRRPSISR